MDDFALLNATIFEADPLPVLLSMLDDDLVPLNGQEPDQQADETTGAGGDPQDVDNPVEEIYVPWVGDLPDIIDNDHSYSAYEPETSSSLSPQEPVDPFSGQIRISCMDDLRYLAAAGEPVFGEVIDDIDMEGWAAGFDDMFKFLKLGERFVFDTPEAFEAFWWESDIRTMVRDASVIIANAPTPPDGFYDSDVAGTPYVATPEHLAASVAGLQNWVGERDMEVDDMADD